MKSITIIKLIFFLPLLIFLLTGSMLAQNEGIDRRTGFGGFSIVNTTLAGEWTVEAGGLGGAFLTNHFYIGGGGFGLNQKKDNYEYGMGYGGVMSLVVMAVSGKKKNLSVQRVITFGL